MATDASQRRVQSAGNTAARLAMVMEQRSHISWRTGDESPSWKKNAEGCVGCLWCDQLIGWPYSLIALGVAWVALSSLLWAKSAELEISDVYFWLMGLMMLAGLVVWTVVTVKRFHSQAHQSTGAALPTERQDQCERDKSAEERYKRGVRRMLVSAMLFSFIILGLAALLVLQSPSLAVDVPEWAAATVVIAGAVILILLPTMLSVIDCLAQVSAQRSFFGHLQQAVHDRDAEAARFPHQHNAPNNVMVRSTMSAVAGDGDMQREARVIEPPHSVQHPPASSRHQTNPHGNPPSGQQLPAIDVPRLMVPPRRSMGTSNDDSGGGGCGGGGSSSSSASTASAVPSTEDREAHRSDDQAPSTNYRCPITGQPIVWHANPLPAISDPAGPRPDEPSLSVGNNREVGLTGDGSANVSSIPQLHPTDVSCDMEICCHLGSDAWPVARCTFQGCPAALCAMPDLSASRLHHLAEALNVTAQGNEGRLLVRWMGQWKDDEGRSRLVIESIPHGTLAAVLDHHRAAGEFEPVRQAVQLKVAMQVCEAMQALTKAGVVHGDLCLASILPWKPFDPNNISSVELKVSAIHTSNPKAPPSAALRTLSPEAIADGVRNEASDVWAFGVCVWQVALLGVRPYPEVTDDDVVKDGVCGGRLRLTAPPAMLPDLWAIVERCMRFNPKERPTFERLTMELKRAAIGWYRDVAGTLMASSSTE